MMDEQKVKRAVDLWQVYLAAPPLSPLRNSFSHLGTYLKLSHDERMLFQRLVGWADEPGG